MILFIDEDATFRTALAALLREDGHAVQEYARTTELPPLDALNTVSVAIIDHTARKENQLNFVDAFHHAHPGTPILILAGYWSLQLAGEAGTRPFVHLVRKPIRCEELRCLVRNVNPKRA